MYNTSQYRICIELFFFWTCMTHFTFSFLSSHRSGSSQKINVLEGNEYISLHSTSNAQYKINMTQKTLENVSFWWYYAVITSSVLSVMFTEVSVHAPLISAPSTPACVMRSAIFFSRSSIRFPISSILVMIWSDIVWNLSCIPSGKVWTCCVDSCIFLGSLLLPNE